jgi:alkanesulfonate monooxygenase SsuD/methylene tetrahydromethanopterin reductase-like flavin-dependent oxidoreductase (luciferase family)
MKVGLILPMTENDHGMKRYRELRDLSCHAESAGLDSIWVCDHMLFRRKGLPPTRGTWEAATLAAGICEATSRAEIGTLVMCTAFRNPALLAKMAVTLDEISDGRLVLGLGAGWHRPEMTAFGLPTTMMISRFEEAVTIIATLLRDGRIDFAGRYYTAPDCEVKPRGPRPSGIPILIGGEGQRVMRLAAQFGDAWNTAWYGTADAMDEHLSAFRAACKDAGRDPAEIDATVGMNARYSSLSDPESKEAVRRTLIGFRQRGIQHVICDINPFDRASIDWFAGLVNESREAVEELT